jgi:hypothetical protein
MGLTYANLDADTRAFGLDEVKVGHLYFSPRLTAAGVEQWPRILSEALDRQDDDWLARQILERGLLNAQESYTRNGKSFTRAINKPHAAQQLAEGEFNRFYLRGLCRRALRDNIPHLIVYRAKAVSQPRAESEAKIGSAIAVNELLAALRTSDFVSIEDTLRVPGGPNSGLSARLP